MKLGTKKLLSYSTLSVRSILGVLFIFSGIEKIINPSSFSEAIYNYHMLPIYVINLLAITIPWLELVCGLLLLFAKWTRESAAILIGLMIVFTFSVFIAYTRGLDIECGCFGSLNSSKVSIYKLLENIVIIAFTSLIFYYREKSTVDGN